MPFSMTAGRNISEGEISKAKAIALELSKKYSLDGITRPGSVNKMVKRAGDAFARRVGNEGGCTVDDKGLVFTFDNCRLNR